MSAQPPVDPGRPPGSSLGSDPASKPGHGYPTQRLSEQQVRHGTSRRPLYLSLAVAVALLLTAGVLFAVFRDKGEDTRAEYCAELEDLTRGGDLSSAVSSADQSSVARLLKMKDIAPDAVSDDWTLVSDVVSSGLEGTDPDLSRMLSVLNAFKVISADAKSNCGLDLNLPSL
ncbi:MAG: hypothetical protein H0T17_03295 [Propionibacteriales bacterium]|nr:hypothetical protein [Propionibacteriales bacterium]